MIPILTADKPTLSPRALRVLRAIDDFWTEHGYAPSAREIVRLAGASSTSVATFHLYRLRTAGMVLWEPYTARTVRLTARGKQALSREG